MNASVTYEDAVDLLDADHKAVKKMFMEHASMSASGAPTTDRYLLSQRICQALTVHAQLEEDIFYPAVREALGDDLLLDHALQEHAQATKLMARIEAMPAAHAGQAAAVQQLGALIDEHVLLEREQIFLRARQAPLDLRGMVLPLRQRQQELTQTPALVLAKESA